MTFYFNFDFKSNTSLLNDSFVDVIQTQCKKPHKNDNFKCF